MSFSFDRARDRDTEATVLPHDLAVLMVGVAARQAASATAVVQCACARPQPMFRPADDRLFRPVTGAFNGAVAREMMRWKME